MVSPDEESDMNKKMKDQRFKNHCKKLAALNAADKSGDSRPRRPVKEKAIVADDLSGMFGDLK
jgi:hypothetical protein